MRRNSAGVQPSLIAQPRGENQLTFLVPGYLVEKREITRRYWKFCNHGDRLLAGPLIEANLSARGGMEICHLAGYTQNHPTRCQKRCFPGSQRKNKTVPPGKVPAPRGSSHSGASLLKQIDRAGQNTWARICPGWQTRPAWNCRSHRFVPSVPGYRCPNFWFHAEDNHDRANVSEKNTLDGEGCSR